MTNKHPEQGARLMRTGIIRAHRKPWKSRMVWVAWEKDVETYLTAVPGTSINDLAEEVGWKLPPGTSRPGRPEPPAHRPGSG